MSAQATLAQVRKAMSLTQTTIATILDTDQSEVSRLEPLGDRGRVIAQLLSDLDIRPALVLERMQIHVMLMVHHESGGPFRSASMLGRSTR